MNKLFIALLGLIVGASQVFGADDFNGTLQWSARIELVNPQMDMVQAALKNPELLSLLLQNPQVHAMLESKLGPIDVATGATRLFPTGFTVVIKGARASLKTEGGMVSRELLSIGEKHVTYAINRPARTYQKLPDAMNSRADFGVKIKVTRMSETATILGYLCRRFLVQAEEGGAKSRFTVWATTEISGLDGAALKRLNWAHLGGPDFMGKIEGVPLKVDGGTPEATVSVVATRIKIGPVDAALFSLPAGFKEVTGAAY